MKVFALVACAILFATSAVSEEIPNEPKPQPHRILTVDHELAVTDVVSRAVDAYSTHRFLTDPCGCYHEMDPIAPKGASYGPIIAFQAGFAVAFITINHFAQKSHHHWVRVGGRLLIAGDIVDEVHSDASNLSIKMTAK
jgi:hypothetical protein